MFSTNPQICIKSQVTRKHNASIFNVFTIIYLYTYEFYPYGLADFSLKKKNTYTLLRVMKMNGVYNVQYLS